MSETNYKKNYYQCNREKRLAYQKEYNKKRKQNLTKTKVKKPQPKQETEINFTINFN